MDEPGNCALTRFGSSLGLLAASKPHNSEAFPKNSFCQEYFVQNLSYPVLWLMVKVLQSCRAQV